MKDTKAILDIAYKECESKIKANYSGYKKYISDFMAARVKQFYANAPYEQVYFTQTDVDDFFKRTKIDVSAIRNAIAHTYYADIANFNPRYAKDEITISLMCLVKYYLKNRSPKDLDNTLVLLSFSGKYYPSIWYGSFPVAAPQEHIMDYVVNNMASNKFDIVKEGNVIGAIRSICNTWINTYPERFRDFHDDDVVYLIQQLHNRIRSFMNNIAELYYEAYNNKTLYMTYDSDDISQDNYHLADNDVMKMERIVSASMNYLTTHGVNYGICKTSSSSVVRMDELKAIIDSILSNDKNLILVREYITLMVATYFQQSTKKDVRDLDFVSYSIKPKPNTKDKYLLRQKELMNIMLLNNSEHFQRRRVRPQTEAAYYKAINSYFALVIQEAIK